MTLVELLVALTIVAVLSTAVSALLSGAGKINQFVNSESTALTQVETAFRRITHNVRTASALTAPANTTTTNTLTVSTQVDASYNGGSVATVTYKISTAGDLVEVDNRLGSTEFVLVTGVRTFSVTRVSLTSPTRLTITITSNTTPAVTRTATITCRNL